MRVFCAHRPRSYAYALWHMFDAALLMAYFVALLLYLLLVGAYVVAEARRCRTAKGRIADTRAPAQISICPPWYQQSTPAQGLPMTALPDYWQGIVHDPMTDFNLRFECVEFRNADAMTLRGWWVPGLDPNPDTAIVFCHGTHTLRGCPLCRNC